MDPLFLFGGDMFKDLVKHIRKRGAKIMVRIPLTRKIPMSPDLEPGDFVGKAVELAILKTLLRRAYEILDIYTVSGQMIVSEGALDKWLSETRHHLGK